MDAIHDEIQQVTERLQEMEREDPSNHSSPNYVRLEERLTELEDHIQPTHDAAACWTCTPVTADEAGIDLDIDAAGRFELAYEAYEDSLNPANY